MLHLYKPERLRELRHRALLSQRDVERLTGISDSTVAYLELGKRKPQTATLRRLLFLYQMNIARWERMERTWDAHEGTPLLTRPN
jgi:transcriptional regulator with XRE-family HTH domain